MSLPLEQIRPDPSQARRLLPPVVRQGFVAGELTPAAALLAWRSLADSDSTERALLDRLVIQLANSIRDQQLVNPITVVPAGDRFVIETGERRWWAHWWLTSQEDRAEFASVRAQVVAHASRQRQAAENLQDEALTAIQEACQVALLVLEFTKDSRQLSGISAPADASGRSNGQDSRQLPALGGSYDVYRQAVDLPRPVMYGVWPQVGAVMGRKDDYCRDIINILRLPDDALALADRRNLNVHQLMEIQKEPDAERQIRLAHLAGAYHLPASQLERLRRERDLDRAEARLHEAEAAHGRTVSRAARSREQIAEDRLWSLTDYLGRVSQTGVHPAELVADHLAADVHRLREARDRISGLRQFLDELDHELERRTAAG